jgi:hypothetical protein
LPKKNLNFVPNSYIYPRPSHKEWLKKLEFLRIRCVRIFTINTNVFVVLIDLLQTKWRILNMMAQTFMGIWLH